jgi:thiol:disulfide interchange protein DsbD
MVWIERLMGVVLLTFGISYIAIALNWPFPSAIVPWALVAGGLYLGWIERSARGSRAFVILQRIAGTIAVVLGLFFLLTVRESVVWEKYRAGILQEAQAGGQPVILDFYADWCIPCHELDQFTYTDARVIKLLSPFRRIKVDTTDGNTEEIKEAILRFDVFGVPTVLFLDGQGVEVPELRMNGFVPPGEFIEAVQSSRLANTLGNVNEGK